MSYPVKPLFGGFLELHRRTFTDTPEREVIHVDQIGGLEPVILKKGTYHVPVLSSGRPFEMPSRGDYHAPYTKLHFKTARDPILVIATMDEVLAGLEQAHKELS